jgi:cell division transport system permease protein
MALRPDYVVRETWSNLRRNVTLTIAAIVTIGVSLSLFGGAMLIRAGVDTLSARWEDDVQIAVFLDRDITEEQQEALESSLDQHPEVARFAYYDEGESLSEAQRLFATNDAMLQRFEENPAIVPTSFRVVPGTVERDAVRSLTAQLAAEPGVMRTTSPVEGVEAVEQVSGSAQRAIFVIAVGLLIAALLLILNAIRMAMFARRREIEVMKLVGATNWFIRVPFMLEGVVQGILGSFIALGSIYALNEFMLDVGRPEVGQPESILTYFVAAPGAVQFVMALVVVLGVVVGAVGSGWAVSRFLRA